MTNASELGKIMNKRGNYAQSMFKFQHLITEAVPHHRGRQPLLEVSPRMGSINLGSLEISSK